MSTFNWYGHPANQIEYDPTKTLPPDEGSVAMGAIAAKALLRVRDLGGEPDLPVRMLDLGVGSGVISAAAVASMVKSQAKPRPLNLQIVGFDIDPYAAELARKNILRVAKGRGAQGLTVHTFTADWNDPAVWERLSRDYEGGFDVITANVPFKLPTDRSQLRPAYREVPGSTYFVDGDDQYAHFRTIFPPVPALLSNRPGATAEFRYPLEEKYRNGWGPFDDLNALLAQACAVDTTSVWALTGDSFPVSPNRVLTDAEVSRFPGDWKERATAWPDVERIEREITRFQRVLGGEAMYGAGWESAPISQTFFTAAEFNSAQF